MEQIIHVTAAFSNAVFMVVLSNVSDFAKRLELPIPTPITASQVAKFQVHPFTNIIGGVMTLTNGDRFFQSLANYIDGYHAYSNYFNLPEDWAYPRDRFKTTNFFGRMNMTTNEVVEFARNALRKLGYDPKAQHADGTPTSFDGPDELWGRTFPYCRVEWRQPEDAPGEFYSITIQVNAEQKRIVGLEIVSTNAWHALPRIDVPVEREVDYRKRIQGTMFIRTNAPPSHPTDKASPQPVPPAKK